MGDFTFRDSASRQVQLFISSVNFTSDQPAPSLIFFHLQRHYDSLPYPKHMLWAHYISMSLATFSISLNQFSTALLVRLFVHWEPEQIFMGLNTEYRARWVKARVNFPITLIHIYWVCQYKLFLLPEGWEGFWRFITFKTFSGTSLDW